MKISHTILKYTNSVLNSNSHTWGRKFKWSTVSSLLSFSLSLSLRLSLSSSLSFCLCLSLPFSSLPPSLPPSLSLSLAAVSLPPSLSHSFARALSFSRALAFYRPISRSLPLLCCSWFDSKFWTIFDKGFWGSRKFKWSTVSSPLSSLSHSLSRSPALFLFLSRSRFLSPYISLSSLALY